MRVLVVEDERDLADALARALRLDGHAVDVALDGAQAFERAALVDYDVVCLDLGLSDMDGRELARRLRALQVATDRPVSRILVTTARGDLAERIAALDEGADDYLVKPFALDELRARVRALLRRELARPAPALTVADLRADRAGHHAWRGDRPLALTAKEFSLLEYFLTHPGELLSHERLLEHVWDVNADPRTNTVRVTIGTLRRKLGDGIAAIETVPGLGYRLTG